MPSVWTTLGRPARRLRDGLNERWRLHQEHKEETAKKKKNKKAAKHISEEEQTLLAASQQRIQEQTELWDAMVPHDRPPVDDGSSVEERGQHERDPPPSEENDQPEQPHDEEAEEPRDIFTGIYRQLARNDMHLERLQFQINRLADVQRMERDPKLHRTYVDELRTSQSGGGGGSSRSPDSGDEEFRNVLSAVELHAARNCQHIGGVPCTVCHTAGDARLDAYGLPLFPNATSNVQFFEHPQYGHMARTTMTLLQQWSLEQPQESESSSAPQSRQRRR